MATAKSTKSPAFQFYPRDFLSSSKVDRMSMTERGAYITLLARCWIDDGLPTSVEELAKLVRMKPSAFSKMWNNSQLGSCFAVRQGRFHNNRLDHERKVQLDYKRKQKANAEKRWESHGNATALPEGDGWHASGNAPLPLPQSASSSAVSTHRQGGAPIHQTHRKHAACGIVCVPADLHERFVRARNHAGADKELRDWYTAVDHAWSEGPMKGQSVGSNDYAFWRARFGERWPSADDAATKSTGKPKWGGWRPAEAS